VKMRRGDPSALDIWRRTGAALEFAAQHPDWRTTFKAYGRVGLIVDPSDAGTDETAEYLRLVARRNVPYRIITRQQLTAASARDCRALLATTLRRPTKSETELLRTFAEAGGVVFAGTAFGTVPKDERYVEEGAGKGRLVIYKDPDPESVARDVKDLLSVEESGIAVFNAPSIITHLSRSETTTVVQFCNYSDTPATAITIRISGVFKRARLFTIEAEPAALAVSSSEGKTEITIPKLALWGGVVIEREP
jgi:hypothetical protein